MNTFLNALRAIVMLAALCVGLALGLRWFVGWMFDGVNSTVLAALVAAMATVLVSVVGVVLARYFERQRQIELEIRERKIPMYQSMVQGLISNLLNATKGGENASEMEGLFASLTPQLISWASDDVIKAWNRFKRRSSEAQSDPVAVMFEFEEVLKAIRVDLGHKSGELAKGDLLGLFVNDIHEHLQS